MADREDTLKNNIKTIIELKGRKRLGFIRDYYSVHILFTSFVLLFVVSFVIFVATQKFPAVTITFHGISVSDYSLDAIQDDLTERLVKKNDRSRFYIKAVRWEETNYYIQNYGIFIFKITDIKRLINPEYFWECDKYLTAGQLDKYSDILMPPKDGGSPVCIAINPGNDYLSGMGIAQFNNVYGLVVFKSSKNLDKIREVVEIILGD